jgi:predicted TIM-barrel fold metal-dependent hydrolase
MEIVELKGIWGYGGDMGIADIMVGKFDRRNFVAGALAAPWLASRVAGAADADAAAIEPTLDLHVHLFGVGEGGTGCRMSTAITDGLSFKFLVFALRLRDARKTLDERYEEVLAEQVQGSGLTCVALLGQDAVYDMHGMPNDYVFDVVARHPRTMVPCPSINPDRADALEELERCHELGARLFKIHPPTQGVDVADAKHARFFRRAAELEMVVLVHTGHEHSAPVIDKHLASPRKLQLALDLGCTVIACHTGSGRQTDAPDQLPEFLALIKRYPKLWGDTAVLGTSGRVRDFIRLLDEPLIRDRPLVRDRLLHGSDFPFPAAPAAFAARIGEEAARRIEREQNWLKKDLDLKEALGVGMAGARRAYTVAKVDSAFWTRNCGALRESFGCYTGNAHLYCKYGSGRIESAGGVSHNAAGRHVADRGFRAK